MQLSDRLYQALGIALQRENARAALRRLEPGDAEPPSLADP